jgi:hypothetical protein
METALVVTQPFATYAKGDRITDPAAVAATLQDHPHRVIRISVPEPEQGRRHQIGS